MSNETARLEAEKELKEMEEQLTQAKEEQDKAKAVEDSQPSPEPIVEPSTEAKPLDETPVTPQQSEAVSQTTEQPKDDAMEWAKRKGYKSPEDMAGNCLRRIRTIIVRSRTRPQHRNHLYNLLGSRRRRWGSVINRSLSISSRLSLACRLAMSRSTTHN